MSNTDNMTCPRGLSAAERFFWHNAGWSYRPGSTTPAEGRKTGAQNLAAVEGLAREAGYTYEWQADPEMDSGEFSNERPVWGLYMCTMRDVKGNPVQHIGGVDFGRDATGPYGDYRRVVEAELADAETDAILASIETNKKGA